MGFDVGVYALSMSAGSALIAAKVVLLAQAAGGARPSAVGLAIIPAVLLPPCTLSPELCFSEPSAIVMRGAGCGRPHRREATRPCRSRSATTESRISPARTAAFDSSDEESP